MQIVAKRVMWVRYIGLSEAVLHHCFDSVCMSGRAIVVGSAAYDTFGSEAEVAGEIIETIDSGISSVAVTVTSEGCAVVDASHAEVGSHEKFLCEIVR